jgi:NADPH:quinone reductase-like Zn-dependent oxidoreductase
VIIVKAMVQNRYGPPESLRLLDVDRPVPGSGEVLLEVRAGSVNPYDWHMLRGDPYVARLTFGRNGWRRPPSPIAGIDAAGRVAEVGPGVRGLRVGDDVLGFAAGSFAEYVATPADRVVPIPAGLTYEQAATLPMAGTTALRGLRSTAALKPGQRLLVIGAGGGIGTFAVQVAVALGAEVTGVCSTRNVELVESLGAARVVDYTREDFAADGATYDAVLDNVGDRSLRRLLRVLTPGGVLVVNSGGSPGKVFGAMGRVIAATLGDRFTRRTLAVLPTVMSQEELLSLTALVADGAVTPVVDRTVTLPEVPEAIARMEQGHTRGKIAVTIP